MWRTDCGERILEGAEALVFAKALSSLLDELIFDTLDDYELGMVCFDNLTFGQRISVLSIIGNGLLRKDIPSVELTAVVEGAIAAVFQHLKYRISYEIDEPEFPSNWRELVIAARKETGMEIDEIASPIETDLDEWDSEVGELSNRILWDVDYESGHIFMDHPPEKSKWLKDMADITDNYYTAIVDDLTEDEADVKIMELRKLCDSVITPS